MRRFGALVAVMPVLPLIAACGGSPSYDIPPAPATPSPAAHLGERIFADTSLSASRVQSCATCHAPARGHPPDNALPAQPGGADLTQQGVRQAPSIRYLRFVPPFRIDSDGTPRGGFFLDGRAASLQEQAGQPFLNPREMAMDSRAAVVLRLAAAPYADEFRAVFGAGVFADPDVAYDRMTFALAQYQKEDEEFASFSSKYDAFLREQVSLSAQELHGLALFNEPAKGNCAVCHPSARGADGSPPLFTDFTYDNLGVPRNPELFANSAPAYFDLGLCARPDGSLRTRAALCGAFRVPSLRNVALRRTFFHNGRFKSLKDTLTFYVQRDTDPEKFYPGVDGVVQKFDDLSAEYRGDVNRTEAPYNRNPGEAPALSDSEIDDVIAFLGTLTDGFVP